MTFKVLSNSSLHCPGMSTSDSDSQNVEKNFRLRYILIDNCLQDGSVPAHRRCYAEHDPGVRLPDWEGLLARRADQHLLGTQAWAGEGEWWILCRLQELELPSQQVRRWHDKGKYWMFNTISSGNRLILR